MPSIRLSPVCKRLVTVMAVIAALSGLGAAEAQTTTEFPLPSASSAPQGITVGPDGALWFTEYVGTGGGTAPVSGSQIGRITTGGIITEFPLPLAASAPNDIVAGPDGALWFVEAGAAQIGRITPYGGITEYPMALPAGTVPGFGGIAAGSDGAIWFVAGFIGPPIVTAVIGRITTAGAITFFTIADGGVPAGIAAGPDSSLWITGASTFQVHQAIVDRLTTSGGGTSFNASALALDMPEGLTAGPDGALWYTEAYSLGRMTTDGAFSSSDTLSTTETDGGPHGIAVGPDGALWFFRSNEDTVGAYDSIGRVTTSQVLSDFPLPSRTYGSQSIVAGPDGAMWFTETNESEFARRLPARRLG